jgi:Ca-activated chloride channel family protein
LNAHWYDSIPPREYIFVVDVSGSMHGFPLETAKVLLRQLIGSLRPTDTFNVILFDGAAHVMAPQSVPADQANIMSALSLIDRQRGGGGTELYKALQKALALPRTEGSARTVIVITDGYIAAERNVFGLISENLNRSNLFAFGIGRAVNRYLIEGMAKTGQGEPFVVTEPGAAEAAAERFKAYVQAPVLTGIKIDFGSFGAYDVEPAVHGDLFAERPLVISGKRKVE